MSGWPTPTGGQEPKWKRSALLGRGGWEPWGGPGGGGEPEVASSGSVMADGFSRVFVLHFVFFEWIVCMFSRQGTLNSLYVVLLELAYSS
uniref:Uncharacterized protein n=1 Tax=Setaria viridis TaxID=4556 RepID=A0A4V6D876_SETVI|nr:hypothetical protein SEVIR_4G189001v2 [Setaria viridis]